MSSTFLVSSTHPVTIRLADADLQAMTHAFSELLPSTARVFLFGSRVDPTKRGGDIDLLVHVPGIAVADALRLEQKLLASLWDEIGDQKIDVVITSELGDRASAFVQLVALDAVPLWP